MADEALEVNATSNTGAAPAAAHAPDPEVVAMGRLTEALGSLDPETRQRILRWAADKYGAPLTTKKRAAAGHEDTADEEAEHTEENGDASFADFASLYEAAAPSADAERALLAGYYIQVLQKNADWDGFSANKQLKHLGHGTSDITGKLDQLINQKPQLVIQTRKSGTTRQAKKKYKVTGEGIKRVKQMLGSAAAAESSNGG